MLLRMIQAKTIVVDYIIFLHWVCHEDSLTFIYSTPCVGKIRNIDWGSTRPCGFPSKDTRDYIATLKPSIKVYTNAALLEHCALDARLHDQPNRCHLKALNISLQYYLDLLLWSRFGSHPRPPNPTGVGTLIKYSPCTRKFSVTVLIRSYKFSDSRSFVYSLCSFPNVPTIYVVSVDFLKEQGNKLSKKSKDLWVVFGRHDGNLMKHVLLKLACKHVLLLQGKASVEAGFRRSGGHGKVPGISMLCIWFFVSHE